MSHTDSLLPLSPVDEVADLSRRYQALKDRFAEVHAIRQVVAMPITISSRFMLRLVVVDATNGHPVAEFHVGAGESKISESWLVDGQVFEV